MKIRLDGKSIRLRLSASEVSQLASTGEVSTATPFSDGAALTARLRTADVPAPVASFDGGIVLVSLPAAQARDWAQSGQTGIYGDSEVLRIMVEKDLRDRCT
jgi:hypothetical protein